MFKVKYVDSIMMLVRLDLNLIVSLFQHKCEVSETVSTTTLACIQDRCHVWHVDKSPGHIHRNQNACLKVLRLSMGKILACIDGLRSELVNKQ